MAAKKMSIRLYKPICIKPKYVKTKLRKFSEINNEELK
jgi:hypothetical protein